MMPVARRVAGVLAFRRFVIHSAGGETHERSIRSGCSFADHERATEVVAGSA